MARTERTFRIYQVMKVIRREQLFLRQVQLERKRNQDKDSQAEDDDKDQDLKVEVQKHMKQQFFICESHCYTQNQQGHRDQEIRNDYIYSLMRLCQGTNHMTKEEMMLFKKRVHLKHNIGQRQRQGGMVNKSADMIRLQNNLGGKSRDAEEETYLPPLTLDKFVDACKQVINDVENKPNKVVIHMFRLVFRHQDERDLIPFSDVELMFEWFASYFQQGDRMMFLKELKTICIQKNNQADMISLTELALLIKSDIEMMPK